MKYLVKSAAVLLTSGLLASLGCGGESDDEGPSGAGGSGNSGQVDTGLPEQTPLGDVSAAQYAAACASLQSSVDSRLGPDVTVPGACEIVGAAAVNTESACQTQADTCRGQVEDGTHPFLTREALDISDVGCQGDVTDLEGCGVTVGQFEACLEDRLIAFERLLSENGCANSNSVDFASAAALLDFGNMATPPSCMPIQAQCPDADPFAAGL
jgi:hypothetical protein